MQPSCTSPGWGHLTMWVCWTPKLAMLSCGSPSQMRTKSSEFNRDKVDVSSGSFSRIILVASFSGMGLEADVFAELERRSERFMG